MDQLKMSPSTSIALSYQRGWELAQQEFQRQYESSAKKLKSKSPGQNYKKIKPV